MLLFNFSISFSAVITNFSRFFIKILLHNIKYFRTIGYKAKTVTPFDMFPYTEEIECVASLTNMMGRKALATVDDDEE